jgi:uncharacterized membrane protein (UPF0136 family)
MTFISTQVDRKHPYQLNAGKSLLSTFNAWAANQELEYHVAWVGVSIISMAGIFFPITMTAVLLNGATFGLIIAAMASLAIVVITNLAAMPVKLTVPFLLLGVLTDLVVIFASFFVH